ncbi:DUF819 family protein [Caproicibacter sp.]|uniref:DUF819 family protein n=1 Tax=Caproicibacter sp. TaxID=2814884 RepID=UPI003989957C
MITNTWLIWGFIVGWAGLSIWLANNTKWGGFLGFVNMGLLGGLILSNLGVVPIKCATYTVVDNYFVPVGIVLMLFMCNLRKLGKCGPKIVGSMVIAAACIFFAGVAGGILFDLGNERWKFVAVSVGDFVGNMQTAAGVATSVKISSANMTFFTAATAIPWVIYSLLSYMVGKSFVPKFLTSYKDINSGMTLTAEEHAAALEKLNSKMVSLNINETAIVFGAAVAIAAVGNWLGELTGFYSIIFYSTIGILVANFTPIHKFVVNDYLASLIFAMYMFKTGCGAHWSKLITVPWQLFLYLIFIYIVSSALLILVSKLIKMPWEYGLMAHMACIGGPVSTPPLAKVYGWSDLVLPGIIIAILGQACGAYAGVLGGAIVQMLGF